MLLPTSSSSSPRKVEWAADALCYGEDGVEPGGAIVPLIEQDFADHSAIDAVIRGEERNPSAWE
ncbi:MAG: hypothetical protein LLF90_04475 [Methanomicrobiaceae archaeon]|nr:hypothetical protein [Methanomicrobiaceae archaeon]